MIETKLFEKAGPLKKAQEERLYRMRRIRNLYSLLRSLVITVLLTAFLFGVVFGNGIIQGQSMVPAFSDGDFVIIWRLSKDYARGDVVFFQGDKEMVKRVAAVPGDTVDVDEAGRLTINGQSLKNTYISSGVDYPITLIKNEYFMLGDNRQVSLDSRDFGIVKKSNIHGKVIFGLCSQVRE